MAKLTFNPNDTEKLSEYLSSLNSVDSLLENSVFIYSSELPDKKIALESVIRFGDLTQEELTKENTKINTIMNNAILYNKPVSESLQTYLVKMSKLTKTKMDRCLDDSYERVSLLPTLEYSLFDMDADYVPHKTGVTSVGESVSFLESMSNINDNSMITPSGILEVCRNYFSYNAEEDSIIEFTNALSERVSNTIEYEMTHEEYHDIPMLYVLSECRHVLKENFCEDDDKCKRIDKMFDEIEKDAKSTLGDFFVKIGKKLNDFAESEDSEWQYINDSCDGKCKKDGEGKKKRKCKGKDKDCDDDFDDDFDDEGEDEFEDDDEDDEFDKDFESMNPFASIYSMCPFPVATRTVNRAAVNCLNAETEEELIESLNKFGQLMTICEVFGDDIVTENAGSVLQKAQRTLARGGAKAASGARAVGKAVHGFADAGKRIVDPMARFIESTYDNIAKADMEERKMAVMSKGLKGKLWKIIKWIKDVGILGLAAYGSSQLGFTVGTVIAAITLVGYIVRNASLNINARTQVIRDLEEELKITKEKIDDSRGDENKQKKYELMRIESKLEKEISRIKVYQNY